MAACVGMYVSMEYVCIRNAVSLRRFYTLVLPSPTLLPSPSSPSSPSSPPPPPLRVQIHGIWFYEAADLERLSTLLNRVKSGLPRQDVLPTVATQPQQVWREVWGRPVLGGRGCLGKTLVPPEATQQQVYSRGRVIFVAPPFPIRAPIAVPPACPP